MTVKGKGGRPKAVIPYDEVERLARFGATQKEIASELDIPLSTMEHDEAFRRAHQKGLDHIRLNIRRAQLALVAQGNATMCIWMGKQYLGQTDRPLLDEDEKGALDALAKAIEASRKKHGM